MSKVSAEAFSLAGDQYMGKPYDSMDCQAFVEAAMRSVGLRINLPGSNAFYRKMNWVGTPEECVDQFGCIPVGALLYILKKDGKEPAQYKGDGAGNASHIGIYTGRTAAQMMKLPYSKLSTEAEKKALRDKCWFGNGAIHSSKSRGCVCTSTFAGKTVRGGGWNRVGLWDVFSYGSQIDRQLDRWAKVDTEIKAGGDTLGDWTKMQVWADNGDSVNLRKQPDRSSPRLSKIPVGTVVEAMPEENGWRPVRFGEITGWMMAVYLRELEPTEDVIKISRAQLQTLYDQIGDLLGLRG